MNRQLLVTATKQDKVIYSAHIGATNYDSLSRQLDRYDAMYNGDLCHSVFVRGVETKIKDITF